MTSTNPIGRPEDRTTANTVDGQLDIFAQVDNTADHLLTPTERFERFHSNNPHVYDALVRLARRYHKATGEKQQSVKRLVEIARWDEKIRSRGDNDFEVNNSFAPYYARLIMLQEEDLDGVFEIRASAEADRWIAILRHYGKARAA
jgi:hypothetical protein